MVCIFHHLKRSHFRDIKPANYAIGRNETAKTIYILDFGIARKITNASNKIKAPREFVHFKGTTRYASLACHLQQEQGKKDHCEQWIYMRGDVSNPDELPWKRM